MQDALPARVFSPDRLREAATAAGYKTQQSLAIRLGKSLRGVQNWYGGSRSPSGETLILLAEVLNREPAWFYVDREEVAA